MYAPHFDTQSFTGGGEPSRRLLNDQKSLAARLRVGVIGVIAAAVGCSAELPQDAGVSESRSATTDASSEQRIEPSDFHYLGAFRLPHVSEGPSNWEYSGYAMTYFPSGDAAGEEDGFPGSLFIVGHDHQQMVAEMSIPRPVISPQRQLTELNVAETLQPFADIRGGLVGELEIPRLGIEYLGETSADSEGRLHFCVGQHFEFDRTPTHGSKGMRLDAADTQGLWFIGDHSHTTNAAGGPSQFVPRRFCLIPMNWPPSHVASCNHGNLNPMPPSTSRSTFSRVTSSTCGRSGTCSARVPLIAATATSTSSNGESKRTRSEAWFTCFASVATESSPGPAVHVADRWVCGMTRRDCHSVSLNCARYRID